MNVRETKKDSLLYRFRLADTTLRVPSNNLGSRTQEKVINKTTVSLEGIGGDDEGTGRGRTEWLPRISVVGGVSRRTEEVTSKGAL